MSAPQTDPAQSPGLCRPVAPRTPVSARRRDRGGSRLEVGGAPDGRSALTPAERGIPCRSDRVHDGALRRRRRSANPPIARNAARASRELSGASTAVSMNPDSWPLPAPRPEIVPLPSVDTAPMSVPLARRSCASRRVRPVSVSSPALRAPAEHLPLTQCCRGNCGRTFLDVARAPSLARWTELALRHCLARALRCHSRARSALAASQRAREDVTISRVAGGIFPCER